MITIVAAGSTIAETALGTHQAAAPQPPGPRIAGEAHRRGRAALSVLCGLALAASTLASHSAWAAVRGEVAVVEEVPENADRNLSERPSDTVTALRELAVELTRKLWRPEQSPQQPLDGIIIEAILHRTSDEQTDRRPESRGTIRRRKTREHDKAWFKVTKDGLELLGHKVAPKGAQANSRGGQSKRMPEYVTALRMDAFNWLLDQSSRGPGKGKNGAFGTKRTSKEVVEPGFGRKYLTAKFSAPHSGARIPSQLTLCDGKNGVWARSKDADPGYRSSKRTR